MKAGFLSSLDGSESLAVLVGSLLATTGWSPWQRPPPPTEQEASSPPPPPLTQLSCFVPIRRSLEAKPLSHVVIRISFWGWPKRETKGEGAMHLGSVKTTESRARTEGRRGMGGQSVGSGDLVHLLTEVWSPVCTGKRE